MTGLFLGTIIGILAFLVIFSFGDFLGYEMNKVNYVGIFVTISIIVVGTLGGVDQERRYYNKYICAYISKKETVEASLKNDILSGKGYIALVEQVVELNAELAEIQYDCKQWYGFCIDNRVLELEPINISGSDKNEQKSM